VYSTRQLPSLGLRWAVTEDSDQPILFIELTRPPECEVRIPESHQPDGKGRLLATFLGRDALERAFDWVDTVELPLLIRLQHSEQPVGPIERVNRKESLTQSNHEVITALAG
jgi:hypothetical protein